MTNRYYVYYNNGCTTDDWLLYGVVDTTSEALHISARIAGASRSEADIFTSDKPIIGSRAIHDAYRASTAERRAAIRAEGGWAP